MLISNIDKTNNYFSRIGIKLCLNQRKDSYTNYIPHQVGVTAESRLTL